MQRRLSVFPVLSLSLGLLSTESFLVGGYMGIVTENFAVVFCGSLLMLLLFSGAVTCGIIGVVQAFSSRGTVTDRIKSLLVLTVVVSFCILLYAVTELGT